MGRAGWSRSTVARLVARRSHDDDAEEHADDERIGQPLRALGRARLCKHVVQVVPILVEIAVAGRVRAAWWYCAR